MSLLEKVIFTADFTSEERTYSGVATMRKKSKKSLEEAMLYGYQFTFKDLSKRQLAIHPDEVACYCSANIPNERKKQMSSYDEAILAAKALSSKKGLDIQIIKIADVSVLADYMVIATGTSSTHVKALADEVEYKLDQAGISVSHIEGYRSNSWILLDYIDVIVNVFDDEARDFYDLERLWQDGESVDLTGIID